MKSVASDVHSLALTSIGRKRIRIAPTQVEIIQHLSLALCESHAGYH